MTETIESIRAMARVLLPVLGESETIYLLEKTPEPKGYNVIGGPAPMLDAPLSRGDGAMVHLLTIDLESVPRMKPMFEGARAVSVFVAGVGDYSGLDYDDGYTAIVPVTAAELARGFTGGQPTEDSGDFIAAAGFSVTPVDVPSKIFESLGYGKEAESAPHYEEISALMTAVYQSPGYVGGKMIGLDPIEGCEHFFLTARLALVHPLNLGDGRSLVAFKEGGFCGG